jgi:DNA topoisomerase I
MMSKKREREKTNKKERKENRSRKKRRRKEGRSPFAKNWRCTSLLERKTGSKNTQKKRGRGLLLDMAFLSTDELEPLCAALVAAHEGEKYDEVSRLVRMLESGRAEVKEEGAAEVKDEEVKDEGSRLAIPIDVLRNTKVGRVVFQISKSKEKVSEEVVALSQSLLDRWKSEAQDQGYKRPAPKPAAAPKKAAPKAAKRKAAASDTTSRRRGGKRRKKESGSASESSSSSDSSSESGSSSSSESSSSSSSESSEEVDPIVDSDEGEEPLSDFVTRVAPPPKEAAKPKRATAKSKTAAKKGAAAKKSAAATSKKRAADSKAEGERPTKRGKTEQQDDESSEEEEEYKWWLDDPLPKGKKWRTLTHNGVIFPPAYVKCDVPLIYDGEEIVLSAAQEELAYYFAQYIESPHNDKPQFRKNWWMEFKRAGTKADRDPRIKDFKKCDFSKLRQHILDVREAKKNRSKEEKDKEKAEKQLIQKKYGFAKVDGHKQKISNFMVELPGLFLGRGDHPKAGMLKRRLTPADVTLNMTKGANVPSVPEGWETYDWKKVVHDDTVSWLAGWQDPVMNQHKYVQLAASSRIKGESDRAKFEKARELRKHIPKIRRYYDRILDKEKPHSLELQKALAMWTIDVLALRVGGEKDEDEADTVGTCSLRVEHVKLVAPSSIQFDFLGKDSMRYLNTAEVPPRVYAGYQKCLKSKKSSEQLFDKLSPSILNDHLKTFMPGLSAKVFRTYNASRTLQDQLRTFFRNADAKRDDKTVKKNMALTVEEKLLFYNRCNRDVAILCNHQRSVPPTHKASMEKLDATIKDVQDFLVDLKAAKAGKKPAKKKRKSDDEKPARKIPEKPEQIKKAIDTQTARLKKLETQKTEKEELSTVALGTSKINYMDPRISVAWAKLVNFPIEKIFSKTLREKFPWAMDVDPNWKF